MVLEQMRLRSANAAIANLYSKDLQAFLGADIPELFLRDLQLQLRSRPSGETAPVTGNLQFSGYHPISSSDRIEVNLSADLASDGIRVTEGRASLNESPFLRVDGLLPITLVREGNTYRQQVDYRARMRASAGLGAHPLLLDWIHTLTDLRIDTPEGDIELSGTLRAPTGRIALQANKVQTAFAVAGENIVIDQPVLHAEFSPSELRLDRATGAIRYEPFSVSARLPMQGADWEALFSEFALPDWRRGSVDLKVTSLRLETLSAIFPDVLGRSGNLSVDATFNRRQGMSGSITIQNLQTRPLPNGSVVDRLNTRLHLEGEHMRIEQFSARVSGQPLNIAGTLSFPDWQSIAYDLSLSGQQLPFWRQDQILLRGDLDLRLQKIADEPSPVLSGDIAFRDSLFIQEVNLFAGGTRTGGRIRPPFFSIDEQPFSEWRLNLHLRGRDFLRIQSPFLVGRVSADFRLAGTLGDPVLYGSAFMDSGSILFNFGTLQIQRAQARISLENPFMIELDTFAQGRSFGYDVTFQLDGTEMDPRVQFTSNPALGQREILQLLVAGVMPEQAGGGAQSGQRYALLLGRNVWQQLFPGSGGSFAERLEIRNGRDISERGRDTYEVEFQLNNRITLHGEYDRFDDFNFGVRWHLFTR
ncbi:MAG: translocation/assembly module TamB [Verrucomicrobia bacterium]|nr:translocation/assembly module TamB [Verrucomicrobiota bacterium]